MPYKDPVKQKEHYRLKHSTEEWKKYRRKYYQKNKSKILKQLQESYKKHRNKRLQSMKEYNTKNKDRLKEYEKIRNKQRRKHLNKTKTNWRKKYPLKALRQQLRYLKKYAIKFDLTAKQYKLALDSWANIIKKRDKVCQVCGSAKHLNAHHIIYKSIQPKLSFNLNNGISLCEIHHKEIHKF